MKRTRFDPRPTTGLVREALFDILNPIPSDFSFLDLFAGTGAVGLAALQAGASTVAFVERSARNIRLIEKGIEKNRFAEDRWSCFRMDALRFIPLCYNKDRRFDCIFLDPPYESGAAQKALTQLARRPLWKPKGRVILETSTRAQAASPTEWGKPKEYRYGETRLLIWRHDEK